VAVVSQGKNSVKSIKRRLAVGLAGLAACTLFLTPAHAHSALLRSTPAMEATLSQSPSIIGAVTFRIEIEE